MENAFSVAGILTVEFGSRGLVQHVDHVKELLNKICSAPYSSKIDRYSIFLEVFDNGNLPLRKKRLNSGFQKCRIYPSRRMVGMDFRLLPEVYSRDESDFRRELADILEKGLIKASTVIACKIDDFDTVRFQADAVIAVDHYRSTELEFKPKHDAVYRRANELKQQLLERSD